MLSSQKYVVCPCNENRNLYKMPIQLPFHCYFLCTKLTLEHYAVWRFHFNSPVLLHFTTWPVVNSLEIKLQQLHVPGDEGSLLNSCYSGLCPIISLFLFWSPVVQPNLSTNESSTYTCCQKPGAEADWIFVASNLVEIYIIFHPCLWSDPQSETNTELEK